MSDIKYTHGTTAWMKNLLDKQFIACQSVKDLYVTCFPIWEQSHIQQFPFTYFGMVAFEGSTFPRVFFSKLKSVQTLHFVVKHLLHVHTHFNVQCLSSCYILIFYKCVSQSDSVTIILWDKVPRLWCSNDCHNILL